jgi:RsiW-degrading membrane proteinase PrsW (M82 family)
MSVLAHVLAGFAPGLFWLWFFWRKDDWEPEPRWAVLKVFALGALSTVPILLLRPHLESLLLRPPGADRDLVDSFLVTAAPEETVKLLAFLLGVLLTRQLDEPLDGIIYGIAAGLGFASVENVFFLVQRQDYFLIVQRAFTATIAHLVLTGMVGWAFGRTFFLRRKTSVTLALSVFAFAIFLHGFYDFFLMRGGGTRFVSLLFLLPSAMILLAIRFRAARARSPRYHDKLS